MDIAADQKDDVKVKEKCPIMGFLKLFSVGFSFAVSCLLFADCHRDAWCSFVAEVAQCRCDDTNRVFYAGCSNHVSYLYHESANGIKEWQIENVNLSKSVRRQFSPDKRNWLTIKGDNDDKFLNWDIKTSANDFVARLPSRSALVKATAECFITDGKYRNGTPMLTCRREYEVLATKSNQLHKGDVICTCWLVDCYSTTTNILANGGEMQRRSIADDQTLYVSWDFKMLSQEKSGRCFFIGDAVAVPIELVWDSDMNHEALIPFEEKMVVDAYVIGSIRNLKGEKDK